MRKIVCPECGTEFESKFCPECGYKAPADEPQNSQIDVDAGFSECSNPLSNDEQEKIINSETKPTKQNFFQKIKHLWKNKISNKQKIAGGIIIVLLTVICYVIYWNCTEFDRIEDKALDIVGMMSTGDGYFTIDTKPEQEIGGYDYSTFFPDHQDKALEAIKYANSALGFNGSTYSKMMETTALMGRQEEENNKYKVSWTYHPDDGLEVTYEKK